MKSVVFSDYIRVGFNDKIIFSREKALFARENRALKKIYHDKHCY
ncbi:hypothetical protein HMPREF0497_0002 [Lentilactobacillus buchneri ATCC 11577]|nr:hypothetical protein HMPREF0497_0002 [Lentilactobacillus buchneri ATCC 11577]